VIYRILTDSLAWHPDPDRAADAEDPGQARPTGTNLGGATRAAVDWQDLPYPRIGNPKARFYFTEAGWRRYGRRVYESGLQAGHQMKVIRLKEPDPSQVVYRDRWQVAILPRKARAE